MLPKNPINKWIKVAGYKMDTQRSVAFLCTNSDIFEKENFKNTNHNSIKNNKIPRNKLSQGGEGPIHCEV